MMDADLRTPEQRARARLDAVFGIGVEAAQQILRTNAEAKRIYDCAIVALVRAEQLLPWLEERIRTGGQGDGYPLEMNPMYAQGRIAAFEAVRIHLQDKEGRL